ncbi:restriction endonuclease subunit S [Acinetobacter baumannii]|uniref:restriction endonuclease subunit S n=1 Tax=Acinetobacter baumannii TaxID=470 RepID=UPI001D192D5A|nr:restriction endonuclease subunit S [Acinetobacter baumannii]
MSHFKFYSAPLSVTKHGIVPQLEHAAKSDNGDNRKLVRKGDYVINSRSDRKGSSGLADLDGSVSLINIVLTPFKTIHPKFSHYLLRSYLFQEEFYKYGHGIVADLWTTNYEDMRNIHLALPSVSEQTQISNFLEQETTRIDTLIAKQEKLIELLEEQRKSIISHAVTKGLNPNAPMKDSGVEWLGEVPNDWNLSRLDAVSKIVRGNSAFSKMDLLESGKYVALQYGKTYKVNEINESFGSYVNQEFFKKSQITEFGDIILISTSETLEDLGHSCFYARHDVGLIGGEQFLLKPKNQNFGKYIYYATKAFSSYLQRYATGLKVFRFNLDDLKKIYIPDISLVEQQKIAEFLDKETARIDISVLKQKSLIEKLKEYRASIISHAVTGKIDVREFY